MPRLRTWLLLLLALALPVEGIASVAPQLECFGSGSTTVESVAAVTMHCHDGQSVDAAKAPPCCGDSCPDIAACAGLLAVSVSSLRFPAAERRMAPDDRYLLPEIASRLAHPFRPPAVSTP